MYYHIQHFKALQSRYSKSTSNVFILCESSQALSCSCCIAKMTSDFVENMRKYCSLHAKHTYFFSQGAFFIDKDHSKGFYDVDTYVTHRILPNYIRSLQFHSLHISCFSMSYNQDESFYSTCLFQNCKRFSTLQKKYLQFQQDS